MWRKLRSVLSVSTLAAMLTTTLAPAAFAANGDFYDKVNNISNSAVDYRTDVGHFNTLMSALDARAQDFIFENGGKWYNYSGMLIDITNQMAAGKSLLDAFTYAKADPTNADVAPVAITVTSASIVNGTMTVSLSRAPTITPSIPDFAVTASGVVVTPTSISTSGSAVTLTIPTVVSTATGKPAVYSVSYKGGAPVVADIQVTNLTPNSVVIGQNFNVVLYAENGAIDEGYTWTYTTNNDALKFIKLTYSNHPAELATSPIIEIFTFQASQAGSFNLHFSMERPWEGSTSSVQTSDYLIDVTSP